MPDGFLVQPPQQDVSAAWLGHDLAKHPEIWTTTLSRGHLTELQETTIKVISSGTDLADIKIENFPLPFLGPILTELKKELIRGRGFAVIRGLNTVGFTEREINTMFFGLGSYLGNARSQNASGQILGHVQDLGANGLDNNVRIYQTSERQTFHTDSCDVVGLLCLRRAKSGGESMLVSASSIYNAFLKRRSDLLPYLFEPVATDRRGAVSYTHLTLPTKA